MEYYKPEMRDSQFTKFINKTEGYGAILSFSFWGSDTIEFYHIFTYGYARDWRPPTCSKSFFFPIQTVSRGSSGSGEEMAVSITAIVPATKWNRNFAKTRI